VEPTGVLLLLVGAMLKSGNNVLIKKMTQEFGNEKEIITAHIFTAIGLIALLCANRLVGTNANIVTVKDSTFWIAILPTMLLNIIIMYGNMYALSKADVSLIGPIISTTPLIVLIPSAIFLQEYPGTLGYIGLTCCAIGLYIFAYQEKIFVTSEDKKNGIEWKLPRALAKLPLLAKFLAPLLMLSRNTGVKIAILTTCCAAFAIVFDKKSTLLAATPLLPLGIIMIWIGFVGIAKNTLISKISAKKITDLAIANFYLLIALIISIIGGKFAWTSVVVLGSIIGFNLKKRLFQIIILSTTVLFLFWFPFYYGHAAYVGSLKRLEVVADLAFGYFILKEKKVKQRIPGAIIMMIGAILITLD